MRRIALFMWVALMVASCGSGNQPGAANSSGPTTNVAPTTTTPRSTTTVGDANIAPGATTPSSTTTVIGTKGIHVALTDLGSILVDGDGFTLYVLLSDTSTTSRCVGGCIDVWPPVTLDDVGTLGDGLDPSRVGEITRPDGRVQVTYTDKPLYRYAGDTAPADVNGQGIDNLWYVIDENGSAIGASAEDDYGGTDY